MPLILQDERQGETEMKMHRTSIALVAIAALALSVSLTLDSGWGLRAAPKLSVEELIAKHLASLGDAEALKNFHQLQATGQGSLIPRLGGTGQIDGSAMITSSGRNWHLDLNFDNPNFPGEDFSYDGDTVQIDQLRPGTRSPLGQLLYSQDRPITEGLMGGTLCTGWPLLDVAGHDPKLKYDGLKKVDGTPLHILEYRPKKSTDFRIRVYFEPETFRHVRTEYKMTISAASVRLGSGADQLPDNRFAVIEEFSDFRAEQGLTLPHSYKIRYMAEGRSSVVLDYEMTFNQIAVQ